jgi:hypothetical protein
VELAYDHDALARVWATRFVCLRIKLILKFCKQFNRVLHFLIIVPYSATFVRFPTTPSTTDLQPSLMVTRWIPNSLSQNKASYNPIASVSWGGIHVSFLSNLALTNSPFSSRIHIPISYPTSWSKMVASTLHDDARLLCY